MTGPCACCNALLPAGKDEFAGEASTNSSNISAVSHAFTPISTPTPGLPNRYTDEKLPKATKLALESFIWSQEHGQIQANSRPHDKPLKSKNPKLYYSHLHIKSYYFCRQCKDYFKTTGATRPKRIPFIALFLCNRVNF